MPSGLDNRSTTKPVRRLEKIAPPSHEARAALQRLLPKPGAREFGQSGGRGSATFGMGNPFPAILMLAFEAQKVIELRLVRIARGGADAQAEMRSMVVEKVHASVEAAGTLMMGGSLETVVDRYREHVAANAKRLMAA